MRAKLGLVFLTIIVAGVCNGQIRLAGSPPATGPAQPGAVWYCWSDAGLARTVGYGADCIWLGGSGLVWRYDAKTGKREVFTPRDGLPLEQDVVAQLAVARDGKCVMRFSVRLPAYLYCPDKGWQELPLPEGRGEVAFGPDNTLYFLQWNGVPQTRIWRRDGAEWKVVAAVPNCQAFVPLKSGFLLGYVQIKVTPDGSSFRNAVAYVGPDGGEAVVYEQEKDLFMEVPLRHFHAGEETYVVFRSRTGENAYRRVTPQKLLEDEQAAKLDPANALPTGESSCDPRGDRDRRAHMMLTPGLLPALLVPQHLADHSDVLDGRRYKYDSAKGVWIDQAANLARVFWNAYDPETREAWWSTTVDNRQVRQLVKLEGNKIHPLRNIPEPDFLGGFTFKDSAGRWWGAGRMSNAETFFACRLDANDDMIRKYPCARGIDGGYRPQVQFSPNGRVWIWTEKASLRYDETKDEFIECEPWDDFAFAFGPWQLSMAGPVSSFGQAVYRKEGETWRPMPEPFGDSSLRGTPGMIRSDRMLISGSCGVLEYGVKTDRWALLHEYGGFRAAFTPTGQRVLVNRYCVLLYDGDPMEPANRQAEKEMAGTNELLKLLDNQSWRVREDATQKLKKLYPAVANRLAAAAKDPSLSEEARLRIGEVLQENKSGALPMNSLFRSMHPLVKGPR
jgi:hypothetical protein